MKKIIIIAMTMVLTLALGLAYAGDESYNGVTDFTGRSHDTFWIDRADAANNIEGASAGGLRVENRPLYNGVTDFTGRSYDTIEIGSADAISSVEGVNAGGLREKGWVSGTGHSYDSLPMNPALE